MASSTTEDDGSTSRQEGSSSDSSRADAAVWATFAVTWAAAVLFHLAGNPRLAPEWGRGLLGAAALAVLFAPRRPWIVVPMAGAVVANVWLEAPGLGNHWLVNGLLALVVIGAVVAGRGDTSQVVRRFVPPARLLLLAFYCFAAFAKLNRDFFDPAVSCAVFYLRESADSWNALGLYDALPTWADMAVAVAVAVIELSIPVLLFFRRSRNAGVVVAITFHWVLAVDRSHQFFDFSSLLTVLFLLFLDPATARAMVDRAESLAAAFGRRWASGPELARLFGLVAAAVAVVAVAGPDRWEVVRPLRQVGVAVWMALGVGVLVMVVLAIRDEPGGDDRPLVGSLTSRWLMVVPFVALLNGLTPYLEVKTGVGWNMYANLSVVDGDSNHYVVRAGLPLTDGHGRLVRIIETDDAGLTFYARGWLLPERQLLDYLADRDGVSATGIVDGQRLTYQGGDGGARPTWQQKFQVFRAVDPVGPTACQPAFGPAR